MSELIVTQENFDAEVLQADLPVLLDFYADWCGPCRMLAPVLDELAAAHEGTLQVGRINVDEQAELAAAFGVVSIPTMVVMRDGRVLEQIVGYRSKREIEEILTKTL